MHVNVAAFRKLSNLAPQPPEIARRRKLVAIQQDLVLPMPDVVHSDVSVVQIAASLTKIDWAATL